MTPVRNTGNNPCSEIILSASQFCTLDAFSIVRYMRIGGKLVAVGGWVDFKEVRGGG